MTARPVRWAAAAGVPLGGSLGVIGWMCLLNGLAGAAWPMALGGTAWAVAGAWAIERGLDPDLPHQGARDPLSSPDPQTGTFRFDRSSGYIPHTDTPMWVRVPMRVATAVWAVGAFIAVAYIPLVILMFLGLFAWAVIGIVIEGIGL